MATAEPDPKRRKLRKGTTSCWECKRRKVRCDYDNDVICVQCRRRGIGCTSQEYSGEASLPSGIVQTMGDRIVRMEERLNGLTSGIPTTSSSSTPASHGFPTPASSIPASIQSPANIPSFQVVSKRFIETTNAVISHPHYLSLSKALHDILPSYQDLELICEAGSRIAVYTTQHLRMLETDIRPESFETLRQDLLSKPPLDAHPVILGKYIFSLATFLQYIVPDSNESIKRLTESPKTMMKKLAETAASLVTTNDQLLGTVEGLECLIMEGTFLANTGNIRRAWLTMQRAVGLAQMMGIHRTRSHQSLRFIDPTNTCLDRQVMWFRILYVDRFLGLMLGLSPTSSDTSFASQANLAGLAPFECMQRRHAVIALRIAQLRDIDLNEDHYRRTQEVDVALQEAANGLPDHWWLTPNFSTIEDADVFGETLKLVHQMYHFNLINQLHLPYMLHSNQRTGEEFRQRTEYSKLTCMNACRDILNRFVAFRSFNRVAFCCRSVDFFALMAAMALLLAHLDSHSNDLKGSLQAKLLAHQRLHDRAMINLATNNMECLSKVNNDSLSKESARFLRQLIAVEGDAANGKSLRRTMENEEQSADEQSFARIWIPYFGLITITRKVSAEELNIQHSQSDNQPFGSVNSTQLSPLDSQQDVNEQYSQQPLPLDFTFPELTADSEDWTFQGVDSAFFESLMARDGVAGVAAVSEGDGSWPDW